MKFSCELEDLGRRVLQLSKGKLKTPEKSLEIKNYASRFLKNMYCLGDNAQNTKVVVDLWGRNSLFTYDTDSFEEEYGNELALYGVKVNTVEVNSIGNSGVVTAVVKFSIPKVAKHLHVLSDEKFLNTICKYINYNKLSDSVAERMAGILASSDFVRKDRTLWQFFDKNGEYSFSDGVASSAVVYFIRKNSAYSDWTTKELISAEHFDLLVKDSTEILDDVAGEYFVYSLKEKLKMSKYFSGFGLSDAVSLFTDDTDTVFCLLKLFTIRFTKEDINAHANNTFEE